jgi:predicted component of type VI protein secretion system
MQAVLVMFRADGERRSFSVTRDMTVIGRREDCDLRIPLGDVSRKHCRIVRDGEMLKIEDLGSSNGTYLNAHRVQEALLSPGDSIQVGPVVFVLQVDGEPADDELNPIHMETASEGAASPTLGDDDSAVMEALGIEEEPALEEADALEEITEDQPARASAPDASGELEPLDQVDPLEPDFDITDDSVETEKKQR